MNSDDLQLLSVLARSLTIDAATPEARRFLLASAVWHGLERAEGLLEPTRAVALFSEILAYLALETGRDPTANEGVSPEGWVRRLLGYASADGTK